MRDKDCETEMDPSSTYVQFNNKTLEINVWTNQTRGYYNQLCMTANNTVTNQNHSEFHIRQYPSCSKYIRFRKTADKDIKPAKDYRFFAEILLAKKNDTF